MILRCKNFFFECFVIGAVTILFFIAIEIALGTVRSWRASKQTNPYVQSEIYTDNNYANRLFKEFHELKTQPTPLVHWTYKDKVGQLINVINGRRKTVSNCDSPTADKIFVFGGSTIWGTGTHDESTIPSLIAKKLNRRGCYHVINFGQSGYFSNQEVVALTQELIRGNVPLTAIFYDGVNDSYVGGYSPGNPTQFSGYADWAARLSESDSDQLLNLLKRRWRATSIFSLFRRFGIIPQDDTIYDQVFNNKLINDRARLVIDNYLQNITFISRVATQYKFKALFFWQPYLLSGTKKHLSPHELATIYIASAALTGIVKESYRLIQTRAMPSNFYNVSGVFDNTHTPVYLDECHVSGNNNQLISDVIVKKILETIG